MSHSVASRRYAKALYLLAREQQALESIRADLEALTDLMETSREWKLFVETPVGSLAMRGKILDTLFAGKLHATTLRFLHFIDSKRRMNLLAPMRQAWMALYDDELGIRRATAVSAIPLDAAQQQALAKRLSDRMDAQVILTCTVDPDLIGGIRVLIGDQVLDYSIHSQLDALKKRLIYA